MDTECDQILGYLEESKQHMTDDQYKKTIESLAKLKESVTTYERERYEEETTSGEVRVLFRFLMKVLDTTGFLPDHMRQAVYVAFRRNNYDAAQKFWYEYQHDLIRLRRNERREQRAEE